MVELLENGADVDAVVDRQGSTVLALAAKTRNMDMLRTLLRRGASADHCDELGIDVYVSCWYPNLDRTRASSSRDVFNVLSEYIALDHTYTWGTSRKLTVLQTAATTVDGPDIDALISYGHNIEGADSEGHTALFYAVKFGNLSAFLALLAQGACMDYESFSVETMLQAAIDGGARPAHTDTQARRYGAIAAHLLKYGNPDLNLLFEISNDSPTDPASIRGRSVTLKQIAEAYGPEIEAWFLTLLLESEQPHYFTRKDKRRLRDLGREGYAPQGYVLSDDDDFSRDDKTDQSDDRFDVDDGDDHDGRGGEGDTSSTQDEGVMWQKKSNFGMLSRVCEGVG